MSVRQLPHGVAKLISSTQVISSVSSVVKELLENSIDAGATVIDIRLERNGLDKIEVRDNGTGISTTDIVNVCFANYTSKIHSFEDLERLQSYGFRGEALNSLCAVAQLTITTKTESDAVASAYVYDNNGTVRDVQPSHHLTGTTVTVTNLFRNVPVRKQFYENSRKSSDELKKIEKSVKLLSIIHPKLRVTLVHNKCLIWNKTSVSSLRQSLLQMYASNIVKNLEDVTCNLERLSMDALIVKRDCNLTVVCQPAQDAILFYVNERPVKDKKLEKVILEEMNHLYASTLPSSKCPLTLISVKLPPESLDVNLEPNKMKVFIKDHDEVLNEIREQLMLHLYQRPISDDKEEGASLEKFENPRPPLKKLKISAQTEANSVVEIRSEAPLQSYSADVTDTLAGISESFFEDTMDVDGIPPVEEVKSNTDMFTERKEMLLVKEITIKNTQVMEIMNTHDAGTLYGDVSESNNFQNLGHISCDDLFDTLSVPINGYGTGVAQMSSNNYFGENVNCVNSTGAIVSDEKSVPENLSEDLFETDSKTLKLNTNLENNVHYLDTKRNENSEPQGEISNGKCNDSSLKAEVDVLENSYPETKDSIATLSQWSRGDVRVNGEPLKGGVLMLNKANKTEAVSKKRTVSTDEEFENMNRSVSSQMGRKDMAGFTNFAREVRSEIIKNAPGISFTKVAHQLATRWRELHDDEKEHYKEKAKTATKPQHEKSTSSEYPHEVLFKRKTYSLAISMNEILEQLKCPGKLHSNKNDKCIRLIGPLETKGIWLCKIENDIKALNVLHLQKNVLYHRYLCNSSLSLKKLDEPIKLTIDTLGKDLWSFLLSLEKSCTDDGTMISDSRITSNGFKLAVSEVSSSQTEVLITEISKESDFQAIDTLIETLKLAIENKRLEQCRCTLVQKILLDKVTKACAEKSVPQGTTEIRMLLQYWTQCMEQKNCVTLEDSVMINLHQL